MKGGADVEWIHYMLGFSSGWFALMAFDHGNKKELGYMFAAILMMCLVTGIMFLWKLSLIGSDIVFSEDEKKHMIVIGKQLGFEVTFDESIKGIHLNGEEVNLEEIFPELKEMNEEKSSD